MLLLPFLRDNAVLLLIVYLLAGLTDILDGWLARRLKAESKLGARLDSLGDIFLFGMIAAFFIFQAPGLIKGFMVPICLVIAVKVAALATGLIKYRRFTSIHTTACKIAGLGIFVLPVFAWFGLPLRHGVIAVLVIAFAAALEELLIIATTDKNNIDLDRKSLFTPSGTDKQERQ